MLKVFVRLFQKAVRSRAHSPCRRPQAAKFPHGAFFVPSFVFAPASSKKKRVEVLCNFTVVVPFVDNQTRGCRIMRQPRRSVLPIMRANNIHIRRAGACLPPLFCVRKFRQRIKSLNCLCVFMFNIKIIPFSEQNNFSKTIDKPRYMRYNVFR